MSQTPWATLHSLRPGVKKTSPFTFRASEGIWAGSAGLAKGGAQASGLGPAAAPGARSSRRPLFPAVPKVCAFFGGRRSGAVRRHPARRPLPGPVKPGTPRSAGQQRPWSGPTAELSGRQRPSIASSLTAHARRGRCRTSPFPTAPLPPHRLPHPPAPSRRCSGGDSARTLHSLPQCI